MVEITSIWQECLIALKVAYQNWSKCVIDALIDLEPDYLWWQLPTKHQVLKTQMEQCSFIENCIDFMDGTFIPLASVPHKCAEDYWTQKAFYAYNMMIVYEINQRIIYYELGWCGNAHDLHFLLTLFILAFPTSHSFFLSQEYLLANSGYTYSEILVPRFKRL
ncbi:hypothetical protein CROQUDRAFT_698678 [Cronartium quercuum f. sp. fusiforme G11]|uniref:DDE Tnp4 domain-containing protein n=1 Tax=Cronartium quercuum f. sp. fusiforme G11 TaxID=708437 RepID=A0A9P6TCM9_9BASI|nr:hypothetical protein CROQUDRAFT_698678 [Cronartium quercuum f. sp. fusiforme G11]